MIEEGENKQELLDSEQWESKGIIGPKFKIDRRITRSQSKQLINKEVGLMRQARSNKSEENSPISNEVSQRLEEVGELCGFKKAKGRIKGRKNRENGGKFGTQ